MSSEILKAALKIIIKQNDSVNLQNVLTCLVFCLYLFNILENIINEGLFTKLESWLEFSFLMAANR